MTGGTVSLTGDETSLLAATMIDTPDGHLGPWVEVVERIVAARLAPYAGMTDTFDADAPDSGTPDSVAPIVHRSGCSWETTPYCDCGADPERSAERDVLDRDALRAAHRDSYPMGNIHHGTPECPDWGTFCMECRESWPCEVTRLLDFIDDAVPPTSRVVDSVDYGALVDLCRTVIDVHAEVVMDTPRDRDLHDRAVAMFRARLDQLTGLVASAAPVTGIAEGDALREALEYVRRYAALNFLGAAFDPEHMRAIANYCAGVLNGEPVPDDLADAPEAYFLGVLRENGWTVIPSNVPVPDAAEEV